MFFIAGLTGHVGGAAARRLLEAGRQVRTLARDPAKAAEWAQKGVEVRPGDLNDAAALARALEGVEGGFLLIPPLLAPSPGFPEARAVISSYVEALAASPVPRLVALSSVGSERESGLGNITTTHLMEQAFKTLSFPVAFVRAGSFLENYTFGLDRVAETGWFDSFLQPTDRATPHAATADIGAEVARLLAEGWSGQKIVELGSSLSPDDLARAMGEALGRVVKARAIPREHWPAVLQAMGLKPGTTGPYEEMEDGFNSGWIDFGVPGTQAVAATTAAAAVFSQARKARHAM